MNSSQFKANILARFVLILFMGCNYFATSAQAVTLDQVISHENPAFNAAIARMTVGNDGNVYLFHQRSITNDGYMLRVGADGSQKGGTTIHYSANGLAANAKGRFMVAEAHFIHSATIYDKGFGRAGAFTEFNNENYDAPQWAETGESDDFYAADARAKRIVRISPTGKQVATYPIKATEFRVSEKNQIIYVNTGTLDAYDFEGQELWSLPIGVGGDIWNGYRGGYDVDEKGVLYTASGNNGKVQAYGPDGKLVNEISLQIGEIAADGATRISDLRVSGDDIFIKRNSPTELFQRFDKNTGARKNTVSIDFDRLTVEYPNQTWTAGAEVPFKIGYVSAAGAAPPHWRVWARIFGAPGYREWSLRNGQLQVPADAAGLYQFKVSPEVDPQQRRAASEYMVRDVVQVLIRGSKGTANVLTPDNRVFYGRGEAIPVSVVIRSANGARPAKVNLRFARGKRILAQASVMIPATGAGQITIPAALTSALAPGEYSLLSDAPSLTNVPQGIVIGSGTPSDSPFLRVQFGDYGTDLQYSPLSPFDAPDVTSFYAERSKQIGLNMIAERVGSSHLAWDAGKAALLDELMSRLGKDVTGVAPEKAQTASPFLQTIAAYSATGIHHTPVLLGNDASTTLGVGLDPRKPELLTSELTKVTQALLPFPAFRGWDWAANWWAQVNGAEAAQNPQQKKAYSEALAKARSTGEWNPVLDEVSDLWLQKAPESTKFFQDTLSKITRDKITAVSAPYRNVYAYPPVTFKNVDEVDLQFQAEQMYVPYGFLHNTDFYKRPGKKAWAHPELWNDSGTGEQILRELFGMTMRGADGVGFSGSPGWWGSNGIADDPRQSYNGTISIYRAAFDMLRAYGPWLSSLQNSDKVAIVASPRMFRLDEWGAIYGVHFARIAEAFVSSLHAHHPASIVFVDDMKPDTLKKYKAVLLVGQRIEMEPMLKTALDAAKAAGTAVFYDGTCREELVKAYSPLGVSFNHFEADKHTWGDDPAFWRGRFPSYVMATVPTLKTKLGALMKPVAETDNPEILISQRSAGQGRYLFVLNGTTPDIDPSQLWRQTLFVATRVPVTAPIKLNGDVGTVYDMTAMKPVMPQNGVLSADLRVLPMRIYAILPAPISQIGLRGPRAVVAGGSFSWGVWVQDAQNRPLDASIPVRLRLLDAAGRTMDEANGAAFSRDGAQGKFTIPLDAAAGNFILEATELVSGKSARLPIAVTASTLPLALGNPALPKASTDTESKGTGAATPGQAPVMDFGPHLRDTVLVNSGAIAVMNAMNWDSNLYGVDTATGNVLWKERAGQGFAFAPQALQNGFAVQGFDFDSPSGYHLYLADEAGKSTHRFPLYGLSRRLPQRFLSAMLGDRMNHFAASPDGSWAASYGDLGLAVWDRSGKLLWQQDEWKQTHTSARWRGIAGWNDAFLTTPTVAALDANTLLVIKGLTATAYDARNGETKWQAPLASAGQAIKVQISDDSKTTAVLTTTEGGRVFLLRGGKVIKAIAATGEDMDFSGDGSRVAVVNSTQLKLYGADGGVRWVQNGDEIMVNPRVAPDGRVAACSRLGTLYVLDAEGKVVLQRDMGALVVPTWLPGGDLLASGWMGTVVRLSGDKYSEKWRTRLVPEATDMKGKLLTTDTIAAAALPDWTNDAKTLPLAPNLLAQTHATVTLSINNQKIAMAPRIYDGKTDVPEQPWAAWNDVNWLGEGTAQNFIEMEMRGYNTEVSGITLVEEAARSASWLRDAYLEYWNPKTEEWVFAMPMLSNSATHTHVLPKPISASRWRIALPPGAVSNVWLGEIALHGVASDQFFRDGQLVNPVADLPGNERFLWEDGLPTGMWKGAEIVTDVPGTKPKTGTQSLHLTAREALGYAEEWKKSPWTAVPAWPANAQLKGWYFLPNDGGDGTLRLDIGVPLGEFSYTLANLKKGQWQEFSLTQKMFRNGKGETLDETQPYALLGLKLFPEGVTSLYLDSLRIE